MFSSFADDSSLAVAKAKRAYCASPPHLASTMNPDEGDAQVAMYLISKQESLGPSQSGICIIATLAAIPLRRQQGP